MIALLLILTILILAFEYRKFRVHSMQQRWIESMNVWIEDGQLAKVEQGIKFLHYFEQNSLIAMLRFWSSLENINSEFYMKVSKAHKKEELENQED